MNKVGHLQELHEKYYDKGLRIIAIADEPPEEVQAVMDEKGACYWIGIDDEQATLGRYAGEGSLPIPRYYFVDDEGIVVSSELPDEQQIEELLKRVFEPALGRELHEDLADALAHYERGAAGEAWLAARAFVDDENEFLAEDAVFLREKVEAYLAWQKERIERALAQGKPSDAMGELLVFEIRFAKMEDNAEWASDRVKELEKHEDIHAERFAWDKLRKALAKEAKGVKSKSACKSVIYAYNKIVKSHGGTVAAKIAQERIRALDGK